jgi:hypothetical protein
MTLCDLDNLIRATMDDSAARRDILTGLGDVTEALNIVLHPLMSMMGYSYDADEECWRVPKSVTRQVNQRDRISVQSQ